MASFDPYHKWLGIPPAEQPAHHYRLLAIPEFESDADVIETAAERQTLLLRTFQTGPNSELAERLLNEVSEARVCLLIAEDKARYDQQLKASQQPAPPMAKEIVPEEAPAPLVTPPRLPRSVASKMPSTQTRSRRRPADKPLWQQPWAMATAGVVAVVLLIIFMNSGGNDPKPAGSPKGTTTAKVDPKPDDPKPAIRTLLGHTDYVSSVAFSPDGKRIISGSYDNTLVTWDAESGQQVRTLLGHTGWVRSVAFSPDGKRIVSGSEDKTLIIWDAESGQQVRTLLGHTDSVNSVAFSPDGKRIISGSWDKTIKIWDASSGQHLQTLKGHTHYVKSVAFSPDGKRVVSGSQDKTIKIWDISGLTP